MGIILIAKTVAWMRTIYARKLFSALAASAAISFFLGFQIQNTFLNFIQNSGIQNPFSSLLNLISAEWGTEPAPPELLNAIDFSIQNRAARAQSIPLIDPAILVPRKIIRELYGDQTYRVVRVDLAQPAMLTEKAESGYVESEKNISQDDALRVSQSSGERALPTVRQTVDFEAVNSENDPSYTALAVIQDDQREDRVQEIDYNDLKAAPEVKKPIADNEAVPSFGKQLVSTPVLVQLVATQQPVKAPEIKREVQKIELTPIINTPSEAVKTVTVNIQKPETMALVGRIDLNSANLNTQKFSDKTKVETLTFTDRDVVTVKAPSVGGQKIPSIQELRSEVAKLGMRPTDLLQSDHISTSLSSEAKLAPVGFIPKNHVTPPF